MVCLSGLACLGAAQDNQRSQSESEQGRAQSDFAEFEEIITGLAREKLEMESTVVELMMRLEAAAKHTQALADERTFLQEEKTRSQAVEEGSAQTQWCAFYRTAGLQPALQIRAFMRSSVVVNGPMGACAYRYAAEVKISDGDDVWNFEQLQREKAMLAEELARSAQTCEGMRAEKARLTHAVRAKDKKISYLHEEKDMLTQVSQCVHISRTLSSSSMARW